MLLVDLFDLATDVLDGAVVDGHFEGGGTVESTFEDAVKQLRHSRLDLVYFLSIGGAGGGHPHNSALQVTGAFFLLSLTPTVYQKAKKNQ